MPKPPPEALDQTVTAVRPRGEAWQAYLRQPPLRIGQRAPVLSTVDQRRRTVRQPSPGVPSIWVITCGCRDCSLACSKVYDLKGRLGPAFSGTCFLANTSDFIWERMTTSLGTRLHIVRDRNGSYFRRLRPAGNRYSHLPTVWGIDADGVIRFGARPDRNNRSWVGELQKKLRLSEPETPVSSVISPDP